MRTIEQTGQFKRDYKREAKGLHRQTLANDFVSILTTLANDQPLAEKHRDHALTGDWKDHRDCHVKPDLVLIYRKPNDAVLQLVRLGSHSELGL
jgi:mRNA interferase YafQ